MSMHCCSDGIETSHLQHRQRRVLKLVLAINLGTFAVMVGGSYLSGSSSLLSGTLDNLGDALTYGLSLAVVAAAPAAKARVALFKGVLILAAAVGVALHIAWGIKSGGAPVAETMGIAALINLAGNLVCLRLLHPHRQEDVNMASVWECSRNDVFEGFAVIAATIAVWMTQSGWPDLLIAAALLVVFLRSAVRVLTTAWRELRVLQPQS